MKAIIHILFTTICFLGTFTLSAKNQYNLHFSQISTKDGLSQNTVRSILVDETGFIWAGTLDGLNRYDGYRIVTYKPEVGNRNSLVDHRVKSIHQDKNGLLWIETYNNEFSCYNPTKDAFLDFLPPEVELSEMKYSNFYEASNGDIWLWGKANGCLKISLQDEKLSTSFFFKEQAVGAEFLIEDSDSTIWIGGDFGLHQIIKGEIRSFSQHQSKLTDAVEVLGKLFFTTSNASIIEYDKQSGSFQSYSADNNYSAFTGLAKLNNSTLLITTKSSGVLNYLPETKTFEKPEWANDPKLNGNINFIIDKNDGVWLYNHTGIVWHYNPLYESVRKMELIPQSIIKVIDFERYVIYADSSGLIWITTYGNGLFSYNPKTDELCNYRYIDNQNSPASDYLLSITEDKHGNIWIGSEYAGIIKVVKSNQNVKIVKPEANSSVGKNNNIRSLFIDNKLNYWVGTKAGNLYVYSPTFESKRCIQQNMNPYTLIKGEANEVWVGTKGNGLYIINQNSFEQEAHFSHNSSEKSISNNTIFSLLKDTKGRMWIGTFGGGINLAENNNGNIEFKHFFSNCGTKSYIRHMLQDSFGHIWAATSEGIIRFNPDELINDSNAFVSYKMNINDKNSINCNDIKTIFEDSKNNIWIGTAGGGISQYIPKNNKAKAHFKPYTSANGLAGDFVSGILEDKHNNLWISTESGITKLNTSDYSSTGYHFSEKNFGNHFNENTNVRDVNGNMIWGSLDGLLIFEPESFSPNNDTTSVTLTSFSIHGQTIKANKVGSPLQRSISYTNEIELNYKQNTFSIEFTSLNLQAPLKNKYAYKLENYDTDWSTPGISNVATYKNLSHGTYIFKVCSINNSDVLNEDYTQLRITIEPPLWLSWWAYIIYFLLFILILGICIHLVRKFNILNNNIKVEKQLTEHKIRFFTNISHEFRTPLTLIRGTIENLHELENTSDEIKKQINILGRNSSTLSRLIDQLLEFRKLENNTLSLDLEEIDMVSFCKDIHSSFQEVANQKNIEYSFICGIDSYNMFIDQNKVDKILYNILSNAFKFTPKGGCIEFILQFDIEKNSCLIKIKDNGVGVSKEKQHLLFSRFMQINFSATGTGVGLSLVKDFVDVHLGKIWYNSNQQQGSIFNVELPTNVEIYENANFIGSSKKDVILNDTFSKVIYPSFKVDNNEPLPIANNDSLKQDVLIIDDNEDIRNFLNDELSKYFNTTLAEDGKSGLSKAIELNPYLIICDVMMPEMDGFEVTKQLKNNFNTCHIPVILLTAHSSIEHQLEGIQSGADAYIMKPFSLKYLVTRIFKLIEQREHLKKKFSNDFILDGDLITSTEKDKHFINLINQILEKNISDSQFSVEKFAELARLKRTVFYNKVKGITDLSPNDLIKQKRMQTASELLLKSNDSISEIAYKVGFDDPFYFSKCFKLQYNCSPSKYRKNKPIQE